MELQVLDPFGDYETAGYLRNVYGERNPTLVGHLETAVFQRKVLGTVRYLRRIAILNYDTVTEVHRRIFASLYPWAGQDRWITAPNIAIAKGGYTNLFAHPQDCRRAAEHALKQGQDRAYLRSHPGEVFGYLAHAHPFLEGNGRTILTVFAELTRRANFHLDWKAIDKQTFLRTLTDELLQPGRGTMDSLIVPHMREGVLTPAIQARLLRIRLGGQHEAANSR